MSPTAQPVANANRKARPTVAKHLSAMRRLPCTTDIPIPNMGAINGATNMAPLRAKGVQAYGLGPPISPEDAARIHGHDERTPVEGIGQFVAFVYRAVTDVAAAESPAFPGESR